jgi:hypothetical protein
LEVLDEHDRVLQQPEDDLCQECGLGAEVWPLLTKEALVEKYHKSRDFRRQFREIAKRLALTVRRLFQQERVTNSAAVGLQVYTKLAFVTVKIFTAQWMPPNRIPGCKVVSLPNPEGGEELSGILLQRRGLPADLPHYTVKLSATQHAEMKQFVLSADEIQRHGHCKDMFIYAANRNVSARPSGLRLANLTTNDTADSVDEKVKRLQEEMQAATNERDLQQRAADQGQGAGLAATAVRRVSAGRLGLACPEDRDSEPMAVKKPQPARPKSKASASRACSPSRMGSGASVRTRRPLPGRRAPDGASVVSGAGGTGPTGNDSLLLAMDKTPIKDEGINYDDILLGGNFGRELRSALALAWFATFSDLQTVF